MSIHSSLATRSTAGRPWRSPRWRSGRVRRAGFSLRRHATTLEIANGLLNRFLLLADRRVRLLPEGGEADPLKHTGLLDSFAKTIGPWP